MYCVKCGNNIDEGTKFCRFCGTPAASPEVGSEVCKGDLSNSSQGILKGSLAGKSDEEVLEEVELSLLIAELDEEMAEHKKQEAAEKDLEENVDSAAEVSEDSEVFESADVESLENPETDSQDLVSEILENLETDNQEGPGIVTPMPVPVMETDTHKQEDDDFDGINDEFSDDDYDTDIDVDVEKKTSRKKYHQTGSQRRAAYKAKTDYIRSKSKDKSFQVLLAAVLICLAAIAIAGIIIVRTFLGSKVDDFEKAIEAYEEAMLDNDSAFGAYQQLFENAKEALKDKDTDAFDDLIKQMNEAVEQMTGEMDSQMELSDLKEFYNGIFTNYQITEDYQESYDNLMKRLDAAIESRDEHEARELKKELHSLRVNLGNANQNLVQEKINKINRMNMPKANKSEAKKLEEYKEKVDAALGEENFIEALKVLDEWYETAKEIEKRIQADAEKEKAKYQKESRAQAAKEKEEKAKRESEEAAKRESEEAAKRESEEAAKRESEEAAKRESENAGQQTTTPVTPTSSYIIEGSDTRYLTEADVSGLSAWDKKLARNEIYARHGRRFNNADIQAYFDSQSWYNGTITPENFDTSVLNDFEKKNVELISSLE